MRRLNHESDGTSYWKSMTDVLSALLLVLILLLILFMFNAVTDDDDGAASVIGEGIGVEEMVDSEGTGEGAAPDDGQGGGGGGGGGDAEETEEPQEEPKDDDGKAAVLVVIKDVDTLREIREENVRFELRQRDGGLVTLSTYYPKQITYQDYATQPDGTFFFPEKLAFNTYRLIDLTAPQGYELAAPLEFGIHDSYDWPSPYLVVVYFGPEKNSILVQEVTEDGKPLSHSSEYHVYAEKDIITADGTLRYHKGELVTSFHTNEHGYGTSEEIYLGEYRVVQDVSEEGYAINEDTIVAVISKNSKNANELNQVVCAKTRITVQLVDELDEGLTLSDATYEVTNSADQSAVTITTDNSGYAQIEDLKKDTHYYVKQTSSSSMHFKDDNVYDFYVDQNGLINGEPTAELHHTNRIIKLEIAVVDHVLHRTQSGHTVQVYDSNGNLVADFISSTGNYILEGIEPDRYHIVCDEKEAQAAEVTVIDTADIQQAVVIVRTQTWIVFVAVIGGVILLITLLMAGTLLKKQKK